MGRFSNRNPSQLRQSVWRNRNPRKLDPTFTSTFSLCKTSWKVQVCLCVHNYCVSKGASFNNFSIYWSGSGCFNSFQKAWNLEANTYINSIASLNHVSMIIMIMHNINVTMYFAKFGRATYIFILLTQNVVQRIAWLAGISPLNNTIITFGFGKGQGIAMVKSVTFTLLIWSDMVDMHVPNTFSNKDISGWGTVTSLFLWVLIISSLTLTENICPIWVGTHSLGSSMWLSHPFGKNDCQI